MSILDSIQSALNDDPNEDLKSIPVQYRGSLRDLIDSEASDFVTQGKTSPTGTFYEFARKHPDGKFDTNKDIMDRWNKSMAAYSRARAEATNRNEKDVPTDDVQGIPKDILQKARAQKFFEERFAPEYMKERSATDPALNDLLARHEKGDLQARKELSRLAGEWMNTDETAAKAFSRKMTERFPGWDGMAGRMGWRTWINLTGMGAKAAGTLANLGTALANQGGGTNFDGNTLARDTRNLERDLGGAVRATQDKTGLSGQGRWWEDVGVSAGTSLGGSLLGGGIGSVVGGAAGLTGAAAGQAAMAGAAGFQATGTGTDSYYDARDKGYTPLQAGAYGLAMATVEGAGEMLGNRFIGPGLERMLPGVKMETVRKIVERTKLGQVGQVAKDVARSMGEEVATELIQDAVSKAVSKYSGVNPNAYEKYFDEMGQTIAATILSVGAGTGPKAIVTASQDQKLHKQLTAMREVMSDSDFDAMMKEKGIVYVPPVKPDQDRGKLKTYPESSLFTRPIIESGPAKVAETLSKLNEMSDNPSRKEMESVGVTGKTSAEERSNIKREMQAELQAAIDTTPEPQIEIARNLIGDLPGTSSTGEVPRNQRKLFGSESEKPQGWEPALGTHYKRFYHGGDLSAEGARWFSPRLDYAREYAKKSGGEVGYVDVRVDSPELDSAYDGTNGIWMNAELPESVAKNMKRLWMPPESPQNATGETGLNTQPEALPTQDGGNLEAGLPVEVAEPVQTLTPEQKDPTLAASPDVALAAQERAKEWIARGGVPAVNDADTTVLNPEATPANIAPSVPDPVHGNTKISELRAPPEFRDELMSDEVQKAIASTARGMVKKAGGKGDWEEIAQEANVKLLEHWDSYDPKKGSGMVTWAKQAVRNKFVDLERRRTSQKAGGREGTQSLDYAPEEGKTVGESVPAARKDNQERLRAAFAAEVEKLPDVERDAVLSNRDSKLKREATAKIKAKLEQEFSGDDLMQIGNDEFMTEMAPSAIGPRPAFQAPTPGATQATPDQVIQARAMAVSPPIAWKMLRDMGVEVAFDKLLPKNVGGVVGRPRKPDGTIDLDAIKLRLGLPAFSNDDMLAWIFMHELGHVYQRLGNQVVKTRELGNILGQIQGIVGFTQNDMMTAAGNVDVATVRKEVEDLSTWWHGPLGTSAYRNSDVELYADAVSALLNAPGDVQKRAPNFWAAFWAAAENRPQIKESLLKAYAWMDQSDALIHLVEDGFLSIDQAALEAEKKRHEEARTLKGGWANGVMAYMQDKRVYSLTEAKKQGKQQEFLDVAAIDTTNSAVQADMVNIQKILDDNGIMELGLSTENLGGVLFGERIDKGDRKNMANPMAFSERSSRQLLEQYKAKLTQQQYNALERAASEVRQYFQEQIIEQAYDSQIITKEQRDMARKNPYYATFITDKYAVVNEVDASIQQQIGTLDKIQNPLTSMMQKMIALRFAMRRNMAARAAVELERSRLAALGQRLTTWERSKDTERPHAAAGQMWLPYQEGGKWFEAMVPKHIAGQFEGANALGRVDLFGALNKIQYGVLHKLYVTYNYTFPLANQVRDLERTWTNLRAITKSDGNKITKREFVREIAKGFVAAYHVTQGNITGQTLEALEDSAFSLSNQYNPEGGSQDVNTTFERIMQEQGVKKPELSDNVFQRYLQKAFRFWNAVLQISELTSKITAYNLLRLKGYDRKNAGYLAATYAGTPDTRIGGHLRGPLNLLIGYGNVFTQSVASTIGPGPRSLLADPKTRGSYIYEQLMFGWWLKSLAFGLRNGPAFVALMAGYKALAGLDDDEEDGMTKFLQEVHERYKKVPNYEFLASHFVIPTTSFKDEKGETQYNTFKIPLAPDLKIGNVATFLGMESLFDDGRYPSKTAMAREAASELFKSTVPHGFSTPGNVIWQWAKFHMGGVPYDSFRNKEIIPTSVREADAGYQELTNWTKDQFGILSNLWNAAVGPIGRQPFGRPAKEESLADRAWRLLNPAKQFMGSTSGNMTAQDYATEQAANTEDKQLKLSLGQDIPALTNFKYRADRDVRSGVKADSSLVHKAVLSEWQSIHRKLYEKLQETPDDKELSQGIQDLAKSVRTAIDSNRDNPEVPETTIEQMRKVKMPVVRDLLKKAISDADKKEVGKLRAAIERRKAANP